MNTRFTGALIAIAAVTGAFRLSATLTAGQTQAAYRAPRTANGKPDLNGIWQALNTAHWDIQDHAARPGPPELGALGAVPAGQAVVEGNDIPYQPWAAARKQENLTNRLTADPEVRCFLPGVPRATYMPFPFQILQSPTVIMMAYEYASASRVVSMQSPKPSPIDSWMGSSYGRWEGETLVVDVTGFNDQTWFDRSGNFHSDALHVVERYTRISPVALSYEVTIEDPKVFTRPWRMRMPLYRRLEKNMQILEFKCVEFAEELIYGHLRKKTNP